jgi:hypothetical protein
MRKFVSVLIGLAIPFQALAVLTPNDYCAGFKDVSVHDPQCSAIQYAKNNGIFQGYPDGTFGPAKVINRAEAAKVILSGFKITLLTADGTNLGFNDVKIGTWYMPFLRTAKAQNIIKGYSDGTFRPAATVNRAEMYKMFLETAANVGAKGPDGTNVSKDQFSAPVLYPVAADVSGSEWFAPYFNYAKNIGLIEDAGQTVESLHIYPANGMTRGDLAVLFYDFSPKTM